MANDPRSYRSHVRRGHAGFTLIEVMISVAMVLLLVYGVTQVFKMSSDTVGATHAVATMVRDQRAAIATMKDDFRNCVNDSPMFMIASRVAYLMDGTGTGFKAGFKDAQDELQSLNASKDPSYYWDETSKSEKQYGLTPLNDRTPRLDRLGFFARNLYQRQTAPNDQVYSKVTSTEAYVWYGPVATVRTNVSTGVTDVTNPQNQYGKDRILGRMAILLKLLSASERTAEKPLLKSGNTDDLTPLNGDAKAFECKADLADTSLDDWRVKANTVYAKQPAGAQTGPLNWYLPMVEFNGVQWWGYCRPTLVRPVTSERLSQTVSSFIPHCTQFIVEYAGDFLDQKPDGTVVDAKFKWNPKPPYAPPVEDSEANRKLDGGAIDFVVDPNGSTDPSKWVRRIRWYGLPRDVDGDGLIGMNDVLPLRDVMVDAGLGSDVRAPWEMELPGQRDPSQPPDGPLTYKKLKDYSKFPTSAADQFAYVCAWHNGAPPLIRVTIKLDDPTGRLQGGQWYEFVLSR